MSGSAAPLHDAVLLLDADGIGTLATPSVLAGARGFEVTSFDMTLVVLTRGREEQAPLEMVRRYQLTGARLERLGWDGRPGDLTVSETVGLTFETLTIVNVEPSATGTGTTTTGTGTTTPRTP